jgi:hypothetical protein
MRKVRLLAPECRKVGDQLQKNVEPISLAPQYSRDQPYKRPATKSPSLGTRLQSAPNPVLWRISSRSTATCGGGQAFSVIFVCPSSTLRKELPASRLRICDSGMTSATRPTLHGLTEVLNIDLFVTATTWAPRNPRPPRPVPCANTGSPSTAREAALAVRRAPTYPALPKSDNRNRRPKNTAKPLAPERAATTMVAAPNANAAPVVTLARPSTLATRMAVVSELSGHIALSSSVPG